MAPGRRFGNELPLQRLWRELEVDRILSEFSAGRRFKVDVMNVIKVIVFWRVLDPGGEPSLARSFLPNVYATEVGGIELQYTSWALQVLTAVGPEPEARRTGMMTDRLVAVASLLSFGTPSTYFKGTRPEALASFGFSRYMHGDRPQANLAQRSSRESLLLGRWRYPG